jgi:hypothetical protein
MLLKSADVEIKNMNEGQVGTPFQYSDIHIHRHQQGHLPICLVLLTYQLIL